VKKLPKTRSGKILRSVLRAIVDHREYTVPATIEDTSVLADITDLVGKNVLNRGTPDHKP
jgi:propionyl-CoA synthetase